MKKFTNEKGITLIALVITIIVMLILVAVTINIAISGGLFKKAQDAAIQTQLEADKEELQAAIMGAFNYNEGTVSIEDLERELGDGWSKTGSSFPYTFKKGDTEYSFRVTGKGAITVVEQSSNPSSNTETAQIFNIFLYDIIDETTAKIIDINYDFILEDIPEDDLFLLSMNDSLGTYSEEGYETEEEFEEAITLAPGYEAYTSHLTNIVVPDKVKLNENAEYDEQGTEYTIVGFESYVFSSIYYLESLTLPNTITEIPQSGLEDCTLTSFVVPDSVTSIGANAFYNCSDMESIVIPSSVTTIGIYAFGRCDSLANVYYKGTQAQWNTLISSFDEYDNTYLTSAEITYNYTGTGN